MWHIRKHGKQEKKKREQTNGKAPGNGCCFSPDIPFKNPGNIDLKHLPKGYPQNRNVDTVKKLLNFQDKSGNFYTHLFGAFYLKKLQNLLFLNSLTTNINIFPMQTKIPWKGINNNY